MSTSDEPKKLAWYFTTKYIVIAFLAVGPLAIPLVWFHPRYKKITKTWVTLLTVLLTVLTIYTIKIQVETLMDQLNELGVLEE